jgi:hypothetical protein
MTFTEYCEQNNIQLLADDVKYVRRLVNRLPQYARKQAAHDYVKTWIEHRDNCPCEIKAQNVGRRAANRQLYAKIFGKHDHRM